jgi:outer membrane protein TolC
VLAAKAAGGEARAARLPNLSFSEHYSRTTNPSLVFSNLLGQERFTENNFDPDQLNNPDALNNFSTRLGLYQPLYAAGRISAAVETADLGYDAATHRRDRTRQEVAHHVIEAYSSAVVASRQLDVAQQSKATALANISLVEDLFEVGLVVESDLLQAQVRESEIEEMVVRSESASRVSLAALNLAMGIDLDRHWQLDELEDVDSGDLAQIDIDQLVQEALDLRPDRRAALSETSMAEKKIDLAQSGWRPEIGLAGNVEANGEQILDFSGTNWSVFVLLDVNVFDGLATRRRVEQAKQEQKRASELSALLTDQIGLEIRQARSELGAASERREQATRSTSLAERSLTIVRDRYAEGLATLVELLEAETSLTRARAREVEAQRDLLVARATLELAVGRL